MVVDTTHCLVAGAILLGKEELNIVSWTGETLHPALRGNKQDTFQIEDKMFIKIIDE